MSESTASTIAIQIRDLHLPEPVSWWPMALGWWVLLVLVLLIVITKTVAVIKSRQSLSLIEKTVLRLDACLAVVKSSGNFPEYLSNINIILKRYSINLDDRNKVAGLTGKLWIDWLNTHSTYKISTKTIDVLTVQAYRFQPKVDISLTHQELVDWVHSSIVDQAEQNPNA